MSAARAKARTIYEAVIGEQIGRLAEPLARFHLGSLPQAFRGRASVERGKNALALVIGAIVGLPRALRDCDVHVLVRGDEKTETWERHFDGQPFVSTQYPGEGRWRGLMVERIGPMTFAYALARRGGELHLDFRGWCTFGVPMPKVFGPRVTAFEHEVDGRFNFHVEIGLPVIGRLVRYRGWLVPET